MNFELQNLKIKKNAISSAIENNETFNKSIKYILDKKINGVVGAFVNLIEIPFGFEAAIQTLSGGMFQDIVTQNTEVARNCIELLKKEKMGRASFLPMNDIKVFKNLNFLPKIEKNFSKKLSGEFSESEKKSIVSNTKGQNGIIDFDNCKYISEIDYLKISERSKVNRHDILFAMIGSIGNPVLVSTDMEFSIKNTALFKNISSIIEMRYLYWFLFISQDTMKKQASGGVQSFVSLKFLRDFLLPLPPLAEQKRIVEKIEELLPLCERLK